MSYCETWEVREVATQMTDNALDDTVLNSLIARASRIFDLTCGVEPRYFEAVTSATVATNKTFYGNGGNYLNLPPYVPGSLSQTITFPTGYTVPTFIEKDGYLIITINGILPPFPDFTRFSWPIGSFTYGWPSVAIIVSAKWGYSATPEDVKAAIIELVINLWRETDPAFIKLVNIEGQPLREKIPPRVGEVARRYRTKGAVFV